jgi:hypothetical protein
VHKQKIYVSCSTGSSCCSLVRSPGRWSSWLHEKVPELSLVSWLGWKGRCQQVRSGCALLVPSLPLWNSTGHCYCYSRSSLMDLPSRSPKCWSPIPCLVFQAWQRLDCCFLLLLLVWFLLSLSINCYIHSKISLITLSEGPICFSRDPIWDDYVWLSSGNPMTFFQSGEILN